jgi:two-component system nitrogen regulation response regulator GlnG
MAQSDAAVRVASRGAADESTEGDGAESSAAAATTAVLNLTILAHPDASRVGARVALSAVASGRAVALSRTTPLWAQPGSREAAGLDDRGVSRTPIWIGPATDSGLGPGAGAGALRLWRGEATMEVLVDGEPLGEARELSAEALERGAVLLVAERVALALHLADAVPDWTLPAHGLVGASRRVLRLRRGISQVAGLEVPVLLRGESGAGKELVARAIHEASPRRGGAYVAVNLAAIPPALAAAELFGATRGAYTGADVDRAGFFGRAHGGTLFLDEIGEAAPEVQALLLRALESGEIQPVGGAAPRRVDVRVIAATDADLPAMLATGRFRAPLFHRLSAAALQVPPLRARREDFGRLLHGFLRAELRAAGSEERLGGGGRPWLPAAIVARLAQLAWPGNVRQLRNCARAMVAAARDASCVRWEDVEELAAGAGADGAMPWGLVAKAEAATRSETGTGTWTGAESATGTGSESATGPGSGTGSETGTGSGSGSESVVGAGASSAAVARRGYRAASEVDEDELVEALRRHRWRLTPVARALGIARTSLYALIDRCPRVRKASDLQLGEIERALEGADGDVDAAVELLGVSRHGLLLRLRELRAAQRRRGAAS